MGYTMRKDKIGRVEILRTFKVTVAVLTVLSFAGLLYLLFRGFDPQAIMSNYASPFILALILLGFFLLKALTVIAIESTFLYLAAGMFFPVGQALLLVALGLAIEATVTFYIGYLLGTRRMSVLLAKLRGRKPILDRLVEKVQASDPLLIFMMRMLPGFHNGITSLVLGASGNHYLVYLPVSLIGMLPKAYATTLMGTAIFDPLSPMFLLPLIAYLVIIGMAVLLQRRFMLNGRQERAAAMLSEDPPDSDISSGI